MRRSLSKILDLVSIVGLCILFALFYPPTQVNADDEEDDFINAFGNSNETSGIWQAVRDIATDDEKMKKLCKRAHKLMGLDGDDVIERVKFEARLLTFHTFGGKLNRQPILADIVSYGVTRLPESLFYFTKGTKSDCVFYLILWDTRGTKFRLGLQLCGVHVPV